MIYRQRATWCAVALLWFSQTAGQEDDTPDAALLEFLGDWSPGDLNEGDDDATETNDWLDFVAIAEADSDGDSNSNNGNEHE